MWRPGNEVRILHVGPAQDSDTYRDDKSHIERKFAILQSTLLSGASQTFTYQYKTDPTQATSKVRSPHFGRNPALSMCILVHRY